MVIIVLSAIIIIGLVGLWISAGVSEARELSRRRRRGQNKVRPTTWKIIIGLFVAFEKRVWWTTGIRLPMWRRRLLKRARMTQLLLNREHGTNYDYPIPRPSKMASLLRLG